MFDRIGFPLSDLAKSRAFYMAALAPLGVGVVMESPEVVAFGKPGRAQVWLGVHPPPPHGVHLAFAAVNRAEVCAFYTAALAAGGTDNDAPGLRPHYHPNYHGGFVLDRDGYNVEAGLPQP